MAQPRRDEGLFASLGAVLMALVVGAVVAAMVLYGGGIGPSLRAGPQHAAVGPSAAAG